ncbi:hypothetical protein CAEBREN_28778 [Caenorhabditis brenneri]|uniref:Major facilitator superfamily (MFS) profile domain-containing protein n=1 Tax=Caenorhabditis brenneri TaxID=135651 RepID=G0M7K7_CAEBE|nr:hypothetical protein CAEBREN_28778 [Caenorhabditis brenneri]
MYVTECAPDKNRGFACTALIILNGMVRMVMLPIASPSFLGKSDTWFVFPLAALISGFLNLFLTSRLPESPKWLVCQNRMEEAKKSVEYYHGEDCFANGVLLNFIREKNLTEESHISLREIWENDTLREGLKVLFSYLFFMLFDSANVQAVYSVLLHQSAGYTVQEVRNIELLECSMYFIQALNINLIMTMTFSFIGESTPLMKSRAGTLTMKRNSILNTSRSRTSTYDQKYILNKNIY